MSKKFIWALQYGRMQFGTKLRLFASAIISKIQVPQLKWNAAAATSVIHAHFGVHLRVTEVVADPFSPCVRA